MFSLPGSSELKKSVDQIVRLDDPLHDLYIYTSGDWRNFRSRAVEKEPWTYEWLKDFNKDTVFYDIGACVGSYSLMAAARGATVYAFEPLPMNYAALAENILLNDLGNLIKPVPVLVSDHTGWTDINFHSTATTGYGLASTESRSGMTKTLSVMTDSMNYLNRTSPTHIKIDIEGGEMAILSGLKYPSVQSVIVELASDDHQSKYDSAMNMNGFTGHEVGVRRTMENRTMVYNRD